MSRVKAVSSSGNVFEDLGFDRAEADALLLRSNVMIRLTKHLRAQGKTQKELGQTLGIGQSRVSELLSGKAKLFSLEMLLGFAKKVGMQVDVRIEPVEAPHAEATQSKATNPTATVPDWERERAAAWVAEVRANEYGISGRFLVQGLVLDSDSWNFGPTDRVVPSYSDTNINRRLTERRVVASVAA